MYCFFFSHFIARAAILNSDLRERTMASNEPNKMTEKLTMNWKRIILASNTDTNKFHNIFDELIPHERKRVIKTFLNETAYKGKTIVN